MNKIAKILAAMAVVALTVMLLTCNASAQNSPNTAFKWGLLSTNTTALTINPSASNTTLGGAAVNQSGVKLVPGRGIAVGINFTGGTANVTNTVKVKFALSLDGTNYQTSDQALTWNITPNGTSNVKAVKIWTTADVDNARYFRLLSVENTTTNASASISVTNVTYALGY